MVSLSFQKIPSFTDGFHFVVRVLEIANIGSVCMCLCVSPSDHVCVGLCASMQDIQFNPVTIHLSTEQEKAHMSWVIRVVQWRPLSCPIKMSTNRKQNTGLI